MLARVLLTKVVQCEHRHLLASLVRLTIAVAQRDLDAFRKQLQIVNRDLGYQFRYEEDAFLPALLPRLGQEAIEDELAGHDDVIRCVNSLSDVAASAEITAAHVQAAAPLIWRMTENQCARDRLTVFIGDLSDQAAKSVLEARGTALDDDFDLSTFATWLRQPRPRATDAHKVPHDNQHDGCKS